MSRRTMCLHGKRATTFDCPECGKNGHFAMIKTDAGFVCAKCMEIRDARAAIARFNEQQRIRWDRERAA